MPSIGSSTALNRVRGSFNNTVDMGPESAGAFSLMASRVGFEYGRALVELLQHYLQPLSGSRQSEVSWNSSNWPAYPREIRLPRAENNIGGRKQRHGPNVRLMVGQSLPGWPLCSSPYQRSLCLCQGVLWHFNLRDERSLVCDLVLGGDPPRTVSGPGGIDGRRKWSPACF